MNTTKTNKTRLLRFGKTASKVIEIISWVGAACLLFLSIACLFNSNMTNLLPDGGITMNGMSVSLSEAAEEIPAAAFATALLCGVVCFAIMALVFRNLYAVLRSAESGSPFQPENVKRIETIGWLSILSPFVSLVMSVLCKLFGGPDALEISLDLTGVVMGILVLILSQFFAHGVELEQDVDGLV